MTDPVAATPYNPLARFKTADGIAKFSNTKLQSAIDDAIAAWTRGLPAAEVETRLAARGSRT